MPENISKLDTDQGLWIVLIYRNLHIEIKLVERKLKGIHDYISLFISALVVLDRNGIAWRRSQESGGYKSVKVV